VRAVLDRLGSGARSAPRDTLVAASADDASRGRAFGLEGIGDNVGAFLGPLIAIAFLGLATCRPASAAAMKELWAARRS
jgi:MFS family permease